MEVSRPNTRKYQPRAASAASLVHLAEQQNKYIRFCFPKKIQPKKKDVCINEKKKQKKKTEKRQI